MGPPKPAEMWKPSDARARARPTADPHTAALMRRRQELRRRDTKINARKFTDPSTEPLPRTQHAGRR